MARIESILIVLCVLKCLSSETLSRNLTSALRVLFHNRLQTIQIMDMMYLFYRGRSPRRRRGRSPHQGVPLQRRFMFDLFGHSVQNPADMAHELGIHNTNVGDQTNSLAIQHQAMSAGTNGTGYVQHQNHGGPAFPSQNGAHAYQTDHLPGKCTSVPQHCPPDCSAVDTVTGCIICKSNCRNINVQVLSTSPPLQTTLGGTGTHCPPFPGGCARGSVSLVNGCPVCTAQSTTASPQTTIQPVSPSSTCAPLRCLPPCNKGLTIDSKGCPKCVC